jgi:hypothetical protein
MFTNNDKTAKCVNHNKWMTQFLYIHVHCTDVSFQQGFIMWRIMHSVYHLRLWYTSTGIAMSSDWDESFETTSLLNSTVLWWWYRTYWNSLMLLDFMELKIRTIDEVLKKKCFTKSTTNVDKTAILNKRDSLEKYCFELHLSFHLLQQQQQQQQQHYYYYYYWHVNRAVIII